MKSHDTAKSVLAVPSHATVGVLGARTCELSPRGLSSASPAPRRARYPLGLRVAPAPSGRPQFSAGLVPCPRGSSRSSSRIGHRPGLARQSTRRSRRRPPRARPPCAPAWLVVRRSRSPAAPEGVLRHRAPQPGSPPMAIEWIFWSRGPPLASFRYSVKVSKVPSGRVIEHRSATVVNPIARLLTVICACAGGQVLAAGSDPNAVEPDQSVSQPSAPAPAGVTGARSPTPASSPASTTPAETNPAHLPPAKRGSDAAPTPTSANKPTKIVLRDETLTGEQLKQILAKGYKPEGRGDQVFYCRRESESGTRVETKICRTASVILGLELQSKDITERAQKDNGNPRGQ